MTQAAEPVLTVRSDRSKGSFAAGRDVVVGSDLRADLRVAHPLIARAHLLLRFDHGKWVALDNRSLNGIYLNGQRVPLVDIVDGQTLNIGKPDGPRITFEIGHHTGTVGMLPPTTESIPVITPPVDARRAPPAGQRPPAPPQPRPWQGPNRTTAVPIVRPDAATRSVRQSAGPPELNQPTQIGVSGQVAEFPTTRVKNLGPESERVTDRPGRAAWIGRALDNDIVIHDVLASRHHAFLTPTPAGPEIRDANSSNGTFVNGVKVASAVLSEGDVVTIGNVDLVFSGGIL
ncbi:FHA domain-containing protein, partial [Mycobacterium sp. E3247]|uniref:FHA domain-containing protein n=1 Tax=Mycobacterium sp. E3247 TaxID=1856864 RepID=UPI000AB042FA